jgi:c-di-GMP-binding flagellar brake protein YcgR
MVELFVDPDTIKQGDKAQANVDEKAQRRRWVRLEIFSPVVVHELVVDTEKQAVRRAFKEKSGMILNISGGGVLLSTFDTLTEEDYLLLKFEIKDFEAITDVLGIVKRVENCSDGEKLVGIEFLTPDSLADGWLSDQLVRMIDDPLGFSERLHRLVSRFVFRRQVADTPTE